MIKIIVGSELAEQIRQSDGEIEIVDQNGERLAIVRGLPSENEIEAAKARIGSVGPKFTMDELIARIESS